MRGIDFEVAPRRGLRPARAQRRRQDDDGRDPRGLPRAHRRDRVACSATTRAAPARAARAGRHRAAERPGMYRHLTVREARRALGRALPAPARRRRGRSRLAGLEEKARRARAHALGRPAAAARLRARARRRPRADLPRRADDGLRPRRAARGVGHVRSLQELGKTVLLTTHYLDEAQALADRVAIIKDGRILAEGAAGRARRRRRARYRVTWRDADGELHARETDDPTRAAARADRARRWRAASGCDDLRSRGPRSRTSTWS